MTFPNRHIPDEQPEEYWAQCARLATLVRSRLADPRHPDFEKVASDPLNRLIDNVRTLEQALWTAFIEAKFREVWVTLHEAQKAQDQS